MSRIHQGKTIIRILVKNGLQRPDTHLVSLDVTKPPGSPELESACLDKIQPHGLKR